MKFKPVHLIEQKILNHIKCFAYSRGIRFLQEYIALPKFMPTDGRMHGSVNVNDIKTRLDFIQHNVWSISPVEFFLYEMEHNWTINFSDQLDETTANYIKGFFLESQNAITKIGPFKTKYDAAIYGINMLLKEDDSN